MIKIIKPLLLGLTALISISALASTCPSSTDVICVGAKWGVRGSGWAQISGNICTSTDVVDGFSSMFTLTTYHNVGANGQKFTSGPFSGDYMPIATPFCTYSINNAAKSATLLYAGSGNGSTVSFTAASPENYWSYGSNSYGPVYNCTDPTGANCGLSYP